MAALGKGKHGFRADGVVKRPPWERENMDSVRTGLSHDCWAALGKHGFRTDGVVKRLPCERENMDSVQMGW